MDQTSRSKTIDVPAIPAGSLDRRGMPRGPLRRFLRAFIHFYSYHVILSRRSIRTIRAARFHLRVRPTVFHPRFFLSSEYFAEFLDGLDLSGKSVADIGTGSGILALAAARAGARDVLALDINPNAALSALENAHTNGLGDRVTAVCMNLLAALPARPLFDVIISSPPKHAGEPAISRTAAGTPARGIRTWHPCLSRPASASSPAAVFTSCCRRIPISTCLAD